MTLSKAEKKKLEAVVAYAIEQLDSLSCIAERIVFRPTQIAEKLRFIARILPDLDDKESRHLLHPSLLEGRKSVANACDRLLSRCRIELAIRNEAERMGEQSSPSGKGRGRNITTEEVDWVATKYDKDLEEHPDDSVQMRRLRLAEMATEEFGYNWRPRRIKTALEKRPQR